MENISNSKLLFADLTYKLNGIAIQVRKEVGRYGRERQYCDLYALKLSENELSFERELVVGSSGNRLDFLVEKIIPIEAKAKPFILKEDYFQVQRYLHALNLDLGIIYNFREEYIKPHRILRVP